MINFQIFPKESIASLTILKKKEKNNYNLMKMK